MRPAESVPAPAGAYVDWGVLHISVTNLLIILAMVLVFVLAILLPFPGSGSGGRRAEEVPVRHEDRGGER